MASSAPSVPSYQGALDDAGLAGVRRLECEAAATILRAEQASSSSATTTPGMAGERTNGAAGTFSAAPVAEAARRLAAILSRVGAAAVVGYDDDGIYGHPDHVQVTRGGTAAAALAGVPTVYGATVDREYLHFVESHVVAEAGLVGDLGLVRSHLGVATAEVAVAVDVRAVLADKRAAIAAHASQIPESASVLQLPDDHFADVYGWE